MNRQLQTDSNGNIITKPVAGWSTHRIAGIAVLLAVEYLENPEQFETLEGEVIQLVLTPKQCLELADSLTKAANAILSEPLPPRTSLH